VDIRENCLNLMFESSILLDDVFITDLFNLEEGKTTAKLAVAGAAGAAAGKYAKGVYDKAVAPKHGVVQKQTFWRGEKHGAIEKTDSEKVQAAKEVIGKDISDVKSKASELVAKGTKHLNTAKEYVKTGQAQADVVSAANKVKKVVTDNPVAAAAGGAAIGAGLLYKYFTSISHYKSKLSSLEAKLKSAPPEKKASIQAAVNTVKQKLNVAQAKSRMEHSDFIEKSRQIKTQIGALNKAGNKNAAAKLQAKLDKRQKFLSKIGASI